MKDWKEPKGFEGRYVVSTDGEIISRIHYSKANGIRNRKKPLYLKPGIARGYEMVSLHRFEGSRRVLVHRLVAETFLPNPDNKPEVNHKNGNKRDNRLENLEWMTRSENAKHAFRVIGSRHIRGEECKKSSLTPWDVIFIFNSNMKTKDLAAQFGVSVTAVMCIKNGKTWRHVTKLPNPL